MLFAIPLILVHLIWQCASASRTPPRPSSSKRSSKSTKSRKSSRSRKSHKSSKSKKSGKSKKSRRSSKSRRRSSKSNASTKSNNSASVRSTADSKKGEPKMVSSDKRVQAAIMADKYASQDAIRARMQKQSPELQRDSLADSNKVSYANIRVIPHEVVFKQRGDLKQIRIRNSTDEPVVFMIKCSDNMLYSINPVFGCIDENTETVVNVLRENGCVKYDKLVLITAARVNNKSPSEIFSEIYKSNSVNYNLNVVPLLVQ